MSLNLQHIPLINLRKTFAKLLSIYLHSVENFREFLFQFNLRHSCIPFTSMLTFRYKILNNLKRSKFFGHKYSLFTLFLFLSYVQRTKFPPFLPSSEPISIIFLPIVADLQKCPFPSLSMSWPHIILNKTLM